ncbi:hypothetical protein [Corynebacterium marquesiae]|uniref:hypothetical protein n=1 Tax=Corynebacterium marquesiae TaxID=2913503 RepID=UPI0038CF4005
MALRRINQPQFWEQPAGEKGGWLTTITPPPGVYLTITERKGTATPEVDIRGGEFAAEKYGHWINSDGLTIKTIYAAADTVIYLTGKGPGDGTTKFILIRLRT